MTIISRLYVSIFLCCLALPVSASGKVELTEADEKRIVNQLSTYAAYQFCIYRLGDVGDSRSSMVLAMSDVRQRYASLVKSAGEPKPADVASKAKKFCPYAFDQAYLIKDRSSPGASGKRESTFTRPSLSNCQVSQADIDHLAVTGALSKADKSCLLRIGG